MYHRFKQENLECWLKDEEDEGRHITGCIASGYGEGPSMLLESEIKSNLTLTKPVCKVRIAPHFQHSNLKYSVVVRQCMWVEGKRSEGH